MEYVQNAVDGLYLGTCKIVDRLVFHSLRSEITKLK